MKKAESIQNYTGNYIRTLRQEAGINQEVVARYLGIKRATYSHYETGRLHPSADKLAMLAGYYQVSMDSLCRKPAVTEASSVGTRPDKSEFQTISQEDMALISAYHHLNGKEQRAVWRMVTEMAEGER